MCVKDIIEALSKVQDKDKEVIVYAGGYDYPILQLYMHEDISTIQMNCGFDKLVGGE